MGFENLTVAQLVKKVTLFYETREFITVFRIPPSPFASSSQEQSIILRTITHCFKTRFNPLNTELNPICQ